MRIATALLLMLAICCTLAGLVPCLGWVNWIGVPTAGAAAILGIIGLSTQKNPLTGQPDNQALYICALVLGVVMAGMGMVRCYMGGGVL